MKHAVLTPGLQDCDEATRFVARRESQERQYFWLVPTPQPPCRRKGDVVGVSSLGAEANGTHAASL